MLASRSTSRRTALGFVALIALLTYGHRSSAEASDDRPPNFVVLFVDDLGYGDVGPFGNSVHRTPNLDRLAAEGMKLTSFYAAPCCTPSRAQLMTGCYARRVGLNDGPQAWVLLPKDPIGLNAEEVTLPELLKSQGYATACIGKWHLGDQPPFMPTRHGFDYFFGLPYSNDMWPPFNESDDPKMVALREKYNHAPLPLVRNEQVLQAVEDQSVLTEQYTREAIEFLRRSADRPFFLYLPHTAVHVPLYPGKRFLGKSENGKYGDWVEEVDWRTGEVLGALDELGLSRQTLVVFTSDNGASARWGGSNAPLRGAKGSRYEGGLREPCIVRWPGRIRPGSVCDEVVTEMDLLPTFAKLAGAAPPSDRIIDGRDVWPLLSLQPGAKSPHEAFYYFGRKRLEAVRNGPWKLWLGRKKRLYHLGRDVGETTDVAAEHPEVVERLLALVNRARRDLGDGSPQFPGENLRPPGRVANPRRLIDHDGTIAPDVR